MAHVVVAHWDFVRHFVIGRNLENALQEKHDKLALSKEVIKTYQSAARDRRLRVGGKAVIDEVKELKNKGKATEPVAKSKMDKSTEKLKIPEGLRKEEYVKFIKLAETMSASYLITGGGMLSLLKKERRHFGFIPMDAEDYIST